MGINITVVTRLLVAVTASTGVLLVALALAIPARATVVPASIVALAAFVWFAAGLWLWACWLVHFKRSGQKREFWLCYLLPYGYALYRSVDLVRRRPGHNA